MTLEHTALVDRLGIAERAEDGPNFVSTVCGDAADAIRALSKDAERLDWAENHPEAAYAAISRWWAIAGPGYREVRFNFRNVIDGARAEGKP